MVARVEGEGDSEELKQDVGNFLGTGYMHFLGCIDGFVVQTYIKM